MLRFCDISAYQKSLVLSNLVGQIDGVIIKGTEGTGYVNDCCDPWFQQAKRYGLKLGVYHYAKANSAAAEADYFIKHCRNYFNGDAIPCLDWEEGQSVEWVNEFLRHFHDETGVWPWVYASMATFKEHPGVEENCGRWVAAWPKGQMTFAEAEEYGVRDMVPGLDCAWQFTNVGRLSGYPGDLDLDVFYGDKEAWDKYALGDNEGGSSSSSDELAQVLENAKYKVTIEVKQ